LLLSFNLNFFQHDRHETEAAACFLVYHRCIEAGHVVASTEAAFYRVETATLLGDVKLF
jgi:hypothetical protein